jgi:hypothetical protein
MILQAMETLDLERIRDGFPGITSAFGEMLLEACLVCLEKQDHKPGTTLHVFGDWNVEVELRWNTVVDERMRRTWSNRNEATEYAAVCLVALLVNQLTDYTIIGKAGEKTGIDFWLGNKPFQGTDELFIQSGRLEVSGIFSGTKTQIKRRFQLKLIQSKQSEATNLPVFIGVSEFSKPQTRLEKR